MSNFFKESTRQRMAHEFRREVLPKMKSYYADAFKYIIVPILIILLVASYFILKARGESLGDLIPAIINAISKVEFSTGEKIIASVGVFCPILTCLLPIISGLRYSQSLATNQYQQELEEIVTNRLPEQPIRLLQTSSTGATIPIINQSASFWNQPIQPLEIDHSTPDSTNYAETRTELNLQQKKIL